MTEKQTKELSVQLPATAMPWEGRKPLWSVYGFKQGVGLIEVALGYAVYPEAVLLYSTLKFPSGPPQLWRNHWTSHLEAERAAEALCGEGAEYLESFKAPMRPSEDLDFDDFLEHLHVRLNNDFH